MVSENKGTIALVGSGEFLPPIEPLDRLLLDRLNSPGEPRVLVLPTASAPDGPGVPERWAKLGIDHFTRLGVKVEAAMLLTRAKAQQEEFANQIRQANFIYFSGGKPHYLLDTFQDTPAWEAIKEVYAAGGVIAGCSAGAMVLAAYMFGRGLRVWQPVPALGLAPGLAVIPHFDEMPGWATGISRKLLPDLTIAGVEGNTGLIGSAQTGWTVGGLGSVTIFTHDQAPRQYRAGEEVPLIPPV
jgi:cyanophycinase